MTESAAKSVLLGLVHPVKRLRERAARIQHARIEHYRRLGGRGSLDQSRSKHEVLFIIEHWDEIDPEHPTQIAQSREL